MSWTGDLAKFVKKLLLLEQRVEKNAEDIKNIRQDLKELTDFTRKVAYAVKSYQSKAESERENLILRLENELLKLEKRLSSTSLLNLDSSPLDQRQLSSKDDQE